MKAAAACSAIAVLPSRSRCADNATPELIDRLIHQFIAESSPDGGVDSSKSLWQAAGRGAAVGGNAFPGDIDPRYFRYEVEAFYRLAEQRPDGAKLREFADAKVNFMAKFTPPTHPSWAVGNALELIGSAHQHKRKIDNAATVVQSLVKSMRARSVEVTTLDGVKFRHFPCGYGVLNSKDAGWTNDLSMLGSGLVYAYEVTGDKSILEDAISFAEYFVQPWKPNALGADGYWRCGTFHEKLGSWVIGPSHFTGFESTDVYGDEASWVFSTMTCTDFLMHLHKHKPDPRYVDRCVKAAQWTFRECQFADGGVGMCGRDDKWLGFAADSISQVAMIAPHISHEDATWSTLHEGAKKSWTYLTPRLKTAKIEDHGVEWVNRKSSTDPLCNVAMLWASVLLGWLHGREIFAASKA